MKNLFAYDFTNRTIVATKATLKKASNPTTDEYTALIKMIEGQPTFRVVEKTIKNSGNKKTYKGLTLKMMMDYMIPNRYWYQLNGQSAQANWLEQREAIYSSIQEQEEKAIPQIIFTSEVKIR